MVSTDTLLRELESVQIDLNATTMHLDDLKEQIESLKTEIIKQADNGIAKDVLELKGFAPAAPVPPSPFPKVPLETPRYKPNPKLKSKSKSKSNP